MTKITTPFRGKDATISEVAKELGLSYQLVWTRVTRLNETGDDIERVGKKTAGRKPAVCEYNGKAMSAAEWAEEFGVSRSTIGMRIRRNGSIKPTRKLYDGKNLTEIAKQYGINHSTLISRLSRGESIESAVGPTRPSEQAIDGVPVREIRKSAGVSRQLVDYRVRNGWSLEDAISTPPKRRANNKAEKKEKR